MQWINDRRTAILSALAALLTTISAASQGNSLGPYEVLTAVGAALVAYVAAYQGIGLTEKLVIGAVVTGLGSAAASYLSGADVTDAALVLVLAVLGYFGIGYTLPSTSGSVALRSAEYTLE